MPEKSNHGGKRDGAGRKKKKIASKAVQTKNIKDSKQKDTKGLATERPPFEAQYLDDGNIKAVMKCDKNRECMGFPLVEIENTLNLLTRICKARKGSIGKEELLEKLNASFIVFSGMKPKDSIEAMMITQMIAVHEMTLLAAERSLLTEQPNEFVEQNVNRVTKLCRSYASLVEAFNKYRTKGQQKITVQHVNVNDGGQAVIGDVNQGVGNE